jgi:hypothetical protein
MLGHQRQEAEEDEEEEEEGEEDEEEEKGGGGQERQRLLISHRWTVRVRHGSATSSATCSELCSWPAHVKQASVRTPQHLPLRLALPVACTRQDVCCRMLTYAVACS